MAKAPESYETLPMEWVGDWAGRRAAITPDRPAVFEPETGRRCTYAEMNRRAEKAAAYLRDGLGLRPGDRVALLSRNRLEAVDLYLACGKLGTVLAPLSFRLAARELNDLLRRMGPSVLFYDEGLAETAEGLALPGGCVRREVADGRGDYHDEVEEAAVPAVSGNRPLRLCDPFLYVHTGGTTATPKICVVSHRQMVWNAVDILATSGGALGPQRELLTFPLFHIGGWNTLTPVYYAGGYTVLMRAFDPTRALELIESEGITHMGAVEAMLQFMSESPAFASTELSTLEGITSAGAPCSAWTMQPFWDRGIPVTQSYGQTEAGPSNFMYAAVDASMDEVRRHQDAIGTSMFHTDYRIVDPESLTPVATGEAGVLLMRSPHNFDGYLDEPARTETAFLEEGWIHSGDLAYEDEEGFVRIIGRADNMFISGGENISPEEVEQVLARHAAVDKAAVVGIPDPRWGQVPAAAVVVREGSEASPEQIREYAARELAKFKVPRAVVYLDELPLTGAGKIDRNAVREAIRPEIEGND